MKTCHLPFPRQGTPRFSNKKTPTPVSSHALMQMSLPTCLAIRARTPSLGRTEKPSTAFSMKTLQTCHKSPLLSHAIRRIDSKLRDSQSTRKILTTCWKWSKVLCGRPNNGGQILKKVTKNSPRHHMELLWLNLLVWSNRVRTMIGKGSPAKHTKKNNVDYQST